MIGVLIFNTIAVLFAWLQGNRGFKHGLKLSLFTVFLFLALRYDYGNDYMGYLRLFEKINIDEVNFVTIFKRSFEPGWVFLNVLFAPFGFIAMQVVLAMFTGVVVYRFIKRYCPPKYYWFAVFYYVFDPFQMLILSSAMRQAVAGIFFLLAIDFIVKKKVIHYLILIFIATLFHKTAIFLYPLIMFGFINRRIYILHLLPILSTFFIIILFPNLLFKGITSFLTVDLAKYEAHISHSPSSLSFGFGWALMIIINIIIIYYSRFAKTFAEGVLFKIAVTSFLVFQLVFVIPMATRLTFYLNMVLMVVYPTVFAGIKKNELRLAYMIIVIFYIVFQFYSFFKPNNFGEYFGIYKTIFSAPILQ